MIPWNIALSYSVPASSIPKKQEDRVVGHQACERVEMQISNESEFARPLRARRLG
jgi:hypothetical protein